jgi:phosphoglycolate phosphatase
MDGHAVTRAVLIDLDGTLVDTLGDMTAAINATLADAGRPAVAPAAVAEAVGEGAAILVDLVLGPGASHRWLPVYLRHYRALNGSTARLYPRVAEGLAAMRDDGLALACVTNKPSELVAPLLEAVGIASFFTTCVGGGETTDKKPKPAPLLLACERLAVDVRAAAMIGDSINDAVAARAAGAVSLTVPYGYPGREREAGTAASLLARGLTDAVVADLLAAARWIGVRNDEP